MNCGNAAGMSGIPCIEEIEGSLVSDLSDVDARRAESERLLEAFGHGHFNGRMKEDHVHGRALDFTGVFDDHMALIRVLLNHW